MMLESSLGQVASKGKEVGNALCKKTSDQFAGFLSGRPDAG
jgi:hypothetical protein